MYKNSNHSTCSICFSFSLPKLSKWECDVSATDANDCDDVGGETRAEYSPPAQLSSRRVVNGVKGDA